MDIALYGGSFDPPHLGHVSVVNEALNSLAIDKLIIVPAFVNPFKEGTHAPASLRLAWLREIFEADPRVEVSDFETRQNRAVRSIETVRHYSSLYEKIYFIIGADNLASLKKWHQFDELDKLVIWVVATRDRISVGRDRILLQVEQNISSSRLRETLQEDQLPPKVARSIIEYYTGMTGTPWDRGMSKRKNMQDRINKITTILDKNKAEEIEVFDLRGRDYFVDYVIIASSLGVRHTEALLDHLKRGLKPEEQFLGTDESGEWIAVDLGDILIHIMTPEYRSRYDLETFLSELRKTNEAQ